ncbi:hypothetical protein [Ancylomarina sp.]|uniref:hypothetical protein n=1 Tax=Ancylomarina sp. TaxID=1970196 RepID=UPI003561797B
MLRKISLLLICCACAFGASAQEPDLSKKVNMNFIKRESLQNSDSLYFNVLKVQNLTKDTLRFKLKISLPEELSMMSRIPKSIVLKPGSKKNIPFRLSISNAALSQYDYQILAQLSNEAKEEFDPAITEVRIKEKRNWEMLNPAKELNITSGVLNESYFSLEFRNNGNINEEVSLIIEAPQGYKVKIAGRNAEDYEFVLIAGQGTSLNFVLIRKKNQQALKNQDKIEIKAYNSFRVFRKNIEINAFSSHFEFIKKKIKRNNFIEYSHRTSSSKSKPTQSILTRGFIPFKNKEKKIDYSFMNYNIGEKEDFLKKSNYNLSYSSPKLIVGLGQSSSALGVDLYNPRSAYLNKKFELNTNNKIEFYTSQGVDESISCFGLGYEYKKDKFSIKTSAGYTHNELLQQNVKSIRLQSALPLGEKQRIFITLRGSEREHLFLDTDMSQGLQGNFSYNLNLSKRLNFHLESTFNTPEFYRTRQSVAKYGAKLNYGLPKLKSTLSLEYLRNNKTYISGGFDVSSSSEKSLDNNEYKIFLNLKSSRKVKMRLGAMMDEVNFEDTNKDKQFTQSYNLLVDMRKIGDFQCFGSLIAGYRLKEYDFVNNNPDLEDGGMANIHFDGGLNYQSSGLSVQYDYGPSLSRSSFSSVDYWMLRVSPYFRKEFFNKKLLVQFYADYTRDWGMQRTYMNVRPQVNILFKHNWLFKIEGNLSVNGKKELKFDDDNFRQDIRFSIRKDFNFSRKKDKRKKYGDVDVFFFKDDNKNDVFDKGEKGISNGFLQMSPVANDSISEKYNLSPLLSGDDGKVTYSNIPQGDYDLDIQRMVNVDGYFNFKSSKQNIQLKNDTICYIPFVKAYRIFGKLELKKAGIGSKKINKIKGIRVSAVDSKGREYSSLTDRTGQFMLPVAGKDTYDVSINNPYGRLIKVNGNNTKVNFANNDKEEVNFQFLEKRRRVKMKKASSSLPTETKMEPELKKNIGIKKKVNTEKSKNSELDYWIFTKKSETGNFNDKYWVVGAYSNKTNAQKRVDQINQAGAKWIFVSDKNLYYVFINKTSQAISK